MTDGTTCITRMSSPCRTSGSTPGTPGTRFSRVGAHPRGPRLRQAAARTPAAGPRQSSQRPAACRPVEAPLRLPCMPGSSSGTASTHKIQTGVGHRVAEDLFSQATLPTSPGGVNCQDRSGRNVFEGRVLGLDNISPFDRSAPLPTGGDLEQSDGTAWMTLFSQNMVEISGQAGDDRSELRGDDDQVRRALHVDRLGDGQPGRWHGHVG